MNEQIDFWGYFAKREEAEASADLMRRSGIKAEVVGQAGNWRVKTERPVAFEGESA